MWWTRVAVDYRDSESGQTHHIFGLTGTACATVSAIALNRPLAFPFKAFGISQAERTGSVLALTIKSVALTRDQLQPTSKL